MRLASLTTRLLLVAVLAMMPAGGRAGTVGVRKVPTKRPVVVLVHGIWNTGRMFEPMMAALRREGYACFAPDLQPNDGHLGIRDLTRKLSARIDARFGPKAPLVLVGFSMGGLVARDYVENVAADRGRVRGVFLIASAARGTLWANLSPRVGQRQMAIGSPFLRGLNGRDKVWRDVPLHSYWTPLDLMVVPAVNARWPEGESTRVWCPVHPWMVRNREVIADLSARLRALP